MSSTIEDITDGFFQRVINSVRTAIMVVDKDLIVTYVNDGTKKLLSENADVFANAYKGFDTENIIGSCIDIFHKNPEHQRRILSDPKNLPHTAEIRIGPMAFSLYITAAYDSQGHHTGSILEWADITREKDAYADFQGQIEAIGKAQAVIEFNMDGTIITANDNFLAVMGYTLDEIQGKHHSMFAEPDYAKSREYKNFWEKLNRGEFDSGEYKRLGKNGREVWIQATYNPIVDLNGKPFKVVKFATDITARNLAAADFQGQIDAIGKSQAVIEFNMDGSIIDANENFLTTMGYTLDEIKGKHHSMFAEPDYARSGEYKSFWEKLNRGEFDSGEYKRLGKGGREIWIQATYNPIFDLNGQPFKVVKYATDITGRKVAIESIKNVLLSMSQGDLTHSIEATLEGEFEVLGGAMNSLIDKLNNLVGDIRNASTHVFSASREIAQGNSDLSQRTESQASSLEETASAMEQLTTTVQQNAENASEATKLSNGAMKKASSGGDVVQNAIAAMDEINKSSRKIADIIGVIDEIAFQTNLLALNAAVEAARAGEQGRGFAVVAAEVRNLAQRSAAAAKEIKGLINDSVEAVGSGTQLVDATGKTFEELVLSVTDVVTMITDIDNASKEQSAGISEVTQAITQMDEMTQQNAALVEEASASSRAMEEQAQALLEQISFFKTDDVNPSGESKQSLQRVEYAGNRQRENVRLAAGSDEEWAEF